MISRNIIAMLLAMIYNGYTHAQNFEWVTGRDINYSMNPGNLNFSVATDPAGNIWLSGMKEFIQSYQSAMGNLFLSRYDAGGNLLDDYEITGSALLKDITTDENGNIYLAGQYITDLIFWEGTQLTFSGPFIDGFLVKVNSAGTIDWVKDLSLLFPDAVPENLTYRDGYLYLAHSSWLSSNISVFNDNGILVKDIEQQGVGIASSVAVDSEGNIYVAGSCPDAGSQFGGVSFPAPFFYSIYLVKYTTEGTPLWVQFMEDVTCVSPHVATRNDDHVILGGPLNIPTTFDTLSFNGPSWVYDLFISCIDPDGHIQWGFEVPQVMTGDASSGESRPFIINADNSVTLAGLLRGTIDWGNAVVSQGVIGYYESLVLNISAEGEALWSKTSNSISYSHASAIASGPDHDLYITGIGHGELSFDTCTYSNPSYYYPYLAKLNTGFSAGQTENNQGSALSIYPNPAHRNLNFSPAILANSTVRILTLSGKEVMISLLKAGTKRLDISGLSSGIYILELQSDQGIKISRLVIQ
jgi:hypothetical protein